MILIDFDGKINWNRNSFELMKIENIHTHTNWSFSSTLGTIKALGKVLEEKTAFRSSAAYSVSILLILTADSLRPKSNVGSNLVMLSLHSAWNIEVKY